MKKLFLLLTVSLLFTSCKTEKKGNPAEKKTLVREEIVYQLIKVDNKEVFDVFFRISNQTPKAKTFVNLAQSINANFILQRKYLMNGKKAEIQKKNDLTDTILNAETKDGWSIPGEVVLGISIPPEKFELKPGEEKSFMILSAYSRNELEKVFKEKNCNSLLMRAEYTNDGDDPIITNEIEFK